MKGYDDWKTTNPADETLGRSNGQPEPYGCLDCDWRGTGYSVACAHFWSTWHNVKPMTDPRFKTGRRKEERTA